MGAHPVKQTVLDASAVMTLLYNRSGADKVMALLDGANQDQLELLISVVNWGEVYYCTWRAEGYEAAEQVLRNLARLPIKIVDADPQITKIAAEFRANYKLPYADCFAAALTRHQKATLATADNDFRLVAKQVSIFWTL